MPKATRQIVEQELDDWARLGVDGHFDAATPWYPYHETLREPAARLVGAQPNEVVCMNSLTVNLHLLMATFYRPTKARRKILMEDPAFPSDTYAIKSQIAHHGFDPNDSLLLGEAEGRGARAAAGRHRGTDREARRRDRARPFRRSEFLHRPALRHREDHGRGAKARLHRRDRSRARRRQRSAAAARLERRFRGLVFLQISQLRPGRGRRRLRARAARDQSRICRVSPAGGGTIRRRAFGCSSSPISCRCSRPIPGN